MSRQNEGFVAFFREYTQTWVHTVSTAALTAFGLLTFVDRLFAVVAIAAYVLPPIVQYLRRPAGDAVRSTDAEPAESHRESRGGDGTESGARESEAEPRWTAADAPTDETLFDAAVAATGAYAVGAGGTVLAREGDEWAAVLEDGPGAASKALRAVAAVDGGGVWVAGDGGAVGRIDPRTGRHVDHSAPDGDTSAISGVAATSDGATETVLLTDSSGRVRRGRYHDGELAWAEPTKPASGSSVAGVELRGDVGFLCDTGGGVFRTADGGRTFDSLGFDADGTPTDVTGDEETCLVADDDGTVHRYDGSTWTPERVADDPLSALSGGDEGCVAVGGTAAYERFSSADWTRAATPAVASLRGVAVDGARAVAVGDGGTVVERR